MRRTITASLALLPFVLVLGWAAAGVALAGGGCHAEVEPIPTEASSATVKIDGCTFAPTITRVPLGTEVKFINASGSPHDVTGRNFQWGSRELSTGESFTHRFAAPGMYPYSCSLHPGMAGVVAVGSPDISLASDVQAAPVSPAAADVGGDATLSILAAGGLGVLGGALLAGGIVSRRQRDS